MQSRDPEVVARRERVQDLCRQLSKLLSLSREQRDAIDRLLMELDVVRRRAQGRLAVKAAGAGAGARGGRVQGERT